MTISGKMIDKIYNAKERMELYDTERTCWFKNTAVPYTASSYTGNLLKNDFTEKPDTSAPSQNTQDNFFKQSNLYYMYSFFGVDKQFYVCALEIVRNQKDSEDKIILYYDISDTKNYSNSSYLYTGYIDYFDFHVTMKMENPYNKGDQLFIYAKTPFNTNGAARGLVLGLSESLRSPCSFKVIFSKTVLKEDSELKKGLSISTKDVIAEIRRTNNLMGY